MALVPEIYELVKLSLQPMNLWELLIDNHLDMRFRIQSVNLPSIKLNSETRQTGSKHYVKYDPEQEFNIEFLETTDFTTMKFLQKWMDSVYDYKNRVWKTGPNTMKDMTLLLQSDIRVTPSSFFVERQYTRAYRFERVKILNWEELEFTYDDEAYMRIRGEFIADAVYEIPAPVQTSGADPNEI